MFGAPICVLQSVKYTHVMPGDDIYVGVWYFSNWVGVYCYVVRVFDGNVILLSSVCQYQSLCVRSGDILYAVYYIGI